MMPPKAAPSTSSEALLAVARAVDYAHQSRFDSKLSVCTICQALEALDLAYPTWRQRRTSK